MADNTEIFINRLKDLAQRAFNNNQYTFTDFINQAEQDAFYRNQKEFGFVDFDLYGGSIDCDRKVLRFGSEKMFGYGIEYPISCIVVKPLIMKFADELTHRDYLGALMNLGIERNTIGDIKVSDKTAYIFCVDRMSDYIVDNLSKVKHTSVNCKKTDVIPEEIKPIIKDKNIVISSARCDTIVSKIYNLSRSKSIDLFREKKVFVNDRCYENNSGMLKEQDVVTVRGFGKFIFYGIQYETKKGKINVNIGMYSN